MAAWFDMKSLTDLYTDEDRQNMDNSKERINQIIQAEVENNGVLPENIVVAGFSQGGAIALHTALNSPYKLGGCVALSTWLPLASDYATISTTSNSQLKILQIHGNADAVISQARGLESSEKLRSMNFAHPPRFTTIQGMGHTITAAELVDVKNFILSILN